MPPDRPQTQPADKPAANLSATLVADKDTYTLDPADWTHHHLICTRCGKIQEFQDATLRALGARAARSQGFTVTEQRLELYGICRDCARLDGRRSTGRSRAVQGHAQPRSAP